MKINHPSGAKGRDERMFINHPSGAKGRDERMFINPYIFRGYDVRGEVDKDLNPEIVEHLGKSYGAFLKKRGIKKAVVGYDCRLTSPSYSRAIIKGLLFSGIDIVDIGLALVGNIYWAQYYFKAPGCVSVSGSHNPVNYNGFKFGTGFSATMVTEEIEELRQIAQESRFVQGKGELKEQDIREIYFRDLIERFPIPFKFKVVIDPGHSTAGAFAPELLEKAGCEVFPSHCEIDGSFPIGTPDPTEKKVAERLSEKILKEKADLGFSYDSDGDRIGVVDEKGNILWNDVLVALFAADALERNPGAKIVFNTLCSKIVQDVILAKLGQPIMWRTGHSFIKAKAQKEKAAFAGELSGHFYFLDKFYPHDDGCYSTLALLNYLSRIKKTLSEATAGLPKYISSPEIKLFCADDKKVALIAKIAIVLKKDFSEAQVGDESKDSSLPFANARVIDDERAGDGVRLDLPDAMFVIRYSQNGPYLTIKFEAKTAERYDYFKKYISELLYRYEEIDWDSEINVNLESLNYRF